MRITKKENGRDKTVPINVTALQVSDEDCFGNEWESTHSSCVACSMYDECLVYTMSKGTEAKKLEIQGATTYFADETDFSLVDWDALLTVITNNPHQVNLLELRQHVKSVAKVIDDTTVAIKVNNYLIEKGIKTKEGCLYI